MLMCLCSAYCFLRLPDQKSVLQTSYTRLEMRRVEVGISVKRIKPLNKLEKIPHTYFASIPTLERITLRAVQSVMDVSPAKLHRQSVVRMPDAFLVG